MPIHFVWPSTFIHKFAIHFIQPYEIIAPIIAHVHFGSVKRTGVKN